MWTQCSGDGPPRETSAPAVRHICSHKFWYLLFPVVELDAHLVHTERKQRRKMVCSAAVVLSVQWSEINGEWYHQSRGSFSQRIMTESVEVALLLFRPPTRELLMTHLAIQLILICIRIILYNNVQHFSGCSHRSKGPLFREPRELNRISQSTERHFCQRSRYPENKSPTLWRLVALKIHTTLWVFCLCYFRTKALIRWQLLSW